MTEANVFLSLCNYLNQIRIFSKTFDLAQTNQMVVFILFLFKSHLRSKTNKAMAMMYDDHRLLKIL